MARIAQTLLIAMLGISLAGAATATPLSSEAAGKAASSAFDDIVAGRPAVALEKSEPIIVSFEEMQASGRYLCAQTNDQAATLRILDANKTPGKLTIVGLDHCIGYFIKGFALIDLGRASEALKWLQLAHDRAPLHANFTAELAEWYKANRQWQRAYDLFSEASDSADHAAEQDRDSFKARALRGMGFAKIEMGDLDEAERLFKSSLKLTPDNPAAKSELEYIKGLRKRGST